MPWRRILLSSVIAIFMISGFFEAKPQTPQATSAYGAEALYARAAGKSESASADLEIIAHRGANNIFNEHTLTAYEIAADAEVDSIEIDLRMTKDHQLIALHDTTLDRTTTGTGAPEELTLNEIKQLDTVAVFGGKVYKEPVPTLNEIFAAFAQEEHYYIETRLVGGDTKMEEPFIHLLEEYDLLDPEYVSFQSFSKESLQKMQELAPEIRTTLLYGTDKFELEDALNADVDVIGIESRNITQDIVDKIQQQGKEVHVFFTDERTQLVEQQRVIMYGVDGVFTDDIEFTKQVIGQ
ncbi:glycerophosphodiester phosphodiesterase family protein [Oceanobacillus sp. CFH 90083]|uniref:glycerophosphodiester phosphodiesterase n=1 Tax=Oceanobacillus sp. CFH 90083 TaxID=2592336 RepID=UPI00128CFD98|nr:glycerophosphodiester phosphodiesterase family protein [Oceanobacillus sp. CFH 90083]